MNQMLRVRGSRTIQIQPGTVLSGFKLAQQIPIPELNVVGLHFVHEQTKMQYYHYVSPEDTNNVFCIGFNTPNPNSKGLPHILEHTTLCGSQKYPVRDPFFYMLKRSLNTFMNAMTGPSYTIYPFSTVNERDFMNLLGVYLDAVFQPLLKKRDFMQEGHRFEFEGKDNGEDKNIDLETLTLKGVVYNEMKGALENPASFFYSKLCEHTLSETSYEHVLGGCPSVIPDLTHEELLAYHADHYHPTNAVVVTYGDLDFTAHMSIMDDALKGMGPKVRHSIPLLPAEYTAASKGVVMDEGPLDVMGDAERSTRVVVSWVVPSKYFKEDQPVEDICFHYLTFEILSMLLTNGPASPMYKALIDTHMGTDFTPSNGFEQDFRNPLFSFGLQGVNLGQCDEVKIQNAVLEALRKAHAEGFDHDLVDAVVHQIQLSKRHRSSAFGLNLSYASVLNNLQSGSVFPFLMTMASLEKIRNLHKENKMYFSNLIASLFLEVSPRVTMVLKADKDHTEKRRRQELHRIQQKKASLTDEEAQAILKMGQELAEAQNHKPDLSCLPTLKRSDIATSVVPEQRGQIHKFGAKSSAEIIIAACNQLVYSNILIPLDLANFSRDELLLLPTYASLLCSVGAGEYDYEALSTKTERLCSGFDVSIHVAAYPDMKRLLCGLYVQFHALSERHSDALQLLETIFQQVRFDKDDEKVVSRVISLVSSCATSMIQSVPHNGHRYAMAAAAARISPVCRLSCSMEGLEQIVYLKSILDDLTSETAGLAQQRAQSILKDLREIHRKVCTLHAAETWYVCEESEQSLVVEKSLKFLSRVVNESAPEAVNPVQYNSDAYQKPSFVSVSTPGEVCYLSLAMPSNTLYGAKDSAIQQVAFKVLGNEFLHREIREKGGAYGSGASSRPSGNLSFALAMFSYRDPTPLRSFLVMCRGVQEYLCDAQQIEERTVDEALLSMFGMMDAPRTPSSYGTHWYLSRMDDALRQQHRSNLLATTKEDICACVRSLAQNIVDKNVVCVCLGNADLLKPAQGSAEERGMQEWNVSWTAKEY